MRVPPKSSRARFRQFARPFRLFRWGDKTRPHAARASADVTSPEQRSTSVTSGDDSTSSNANAWQRFWRFLRNRGPQNRSAFLLLGTFLRLLPPHRGWLALALTALTLSTVIALILPATPKLAIDYVLTDQPGPQALMEWFGEVVPDAWRPAMEPWIEWSQTAFYFDANRAWLLWWMAGLGVIASLVSLAIDLIGRYALLRVSKRMAVHFRRVLFRHAVQLPLWRVQELKSGGVSSLLRNDGGAPAELVTSFLYTPWRSLVQLVATLAILATVDWMLLLGALVLVPVIWFTHYAWIARLRPMWRGVRNTREQIDGHATEVFGGMRVVRAFAQEFSESRRYAENTHLMTRQEILAWWWSRIVEIGWRTLVPFVGAFVLVYGGTQVLEGRLTLGDLVLFVTYTSMLMGPLESLVSSAATIQSSLAGFDRVMDVFDEDKESQGKSTAAQLGDHWGRGQVELQNVSFQYPGGANPVLQNIDVTIHAGQSVALVGSSGAGKTTLANLIACFYQPQNGEVRIDGHELSSIDAKAVRRLLGIVEQDVFLFDGTLFENIAYARPNASDGEVEAAARQAFAHHFIEELPGRYEARIGERGVKLSGGQKQRIALARAILKDPRILILDEATSNLDAESEAMIQQSLQSLMKGRTSIIIAHRLSTIRHADLILVLDQGRIIERGDHESLLQQRGRYVELLHAQMLDSAPKLES